MSSTNDVSKRSSYPDDQPVKDRTIAIVAVILALLVGVSLFYRVRSLEGQLDATRAEVSSLSQEVGEARLQLIDLAKRPTPNTPASCFRSDDVLAWRFGRWDCVRPDDLLSR